MKSSLRQTHTHLHTHTHIYILIYMVFTSIDLFASNSKLWNMVLIKHRSSTRPIWNEEFRTGVHGCCCFSKSRNNCSTIGIILVVTCMIATTLFILQSSSMDDTTNTGTLLLQMADSIKDVPLLREDTTKTITSEKNSFPTEDDKLVTLSRERKKALSYVQSIKSFDRKLVFYHIPKTAGTAIEYAAGIHHIPWGSCLFNHKPKRDICKYPGKEECTFRLNKW